MEINEGTTIPFWWALVAVPTFIGAVAWMSFIAYASDAHAKRIDDIQLKIDRKEEILIQIREDVAVIKQRLESQQRR